MAIDYIDLMPPGESAPSIAERISSVLAHGLQSEITVCVNPLISPLWLALLERHPHSVFHSPPWLRAVARTYDLDLRALVTLDLMEQPRSGFAYSRVSDFLGDRIISVPFSDYCDPLVDSPETWTPLVDNLLEENVPVQFRLLHNPIPLIDARFAVGRRAKWHGVDLTRDEEAIWQSLDDSSRRNIKKARRGGVVVRLAADVQDLRAFHGLHLGVRKNKYGLLAQPYAFFENIWSEFVERGNGALMIAEYQGQIVAGIMFLIWNDVLYYKFNASNPATLAVRPNDLMIWEGIRYGRSLGLTRLDFGLSDEDQEGLLRFKRKFATVEREITYVRAAPAGLPSDTEREARRVLSQLTGLLTDPSVPDAITARAGDVLYRFFS